MTRKSQLNNVENITWRHLNISGIFQKDMQQVMEGSTPGEMQMKKYSRQATLAKHTESTTFTLFIERQNVRLFVFYVVKTHWEVDVKLYTFLSSALYKTKSSTSYPGCFAFKKRAPATHCNFHICIIKYTY
jgi:hypothetical protein